MLYLDGLFLATKVNSFHCYRLSYAVNLTITFPPDYAYMTRDGRNVLNDNRSFLDIAV